jgi:3-methyladenine DNA glycosylase/8-oxoguanine DNA glycosylase
MATARLYVWKRDAFVTTTLTIPLVGPGGEPVSFARTINSHGVADLPPAAVGEGTYTTTVSVPVGRPRTIVIAEARPGVASVTLQGPRIGARAAEALEGATRRMLNLDEDLSGFYALAADDPDLSWVRAGAGRMLRPPTVFEAVVKTICTTNTAWSGTVRMVTALVDVLGEPALAGPGRAFPTPAAMAAQPDAFYRDEVRAGYRGPYLRAVAAGVAEGSIDLEPFASDAALSDEEVEARLLALPGVGPYAAAHTMMLLGRHSRLILDSWTRPTYARITGRKTVKDTTIVRRFRRYGPYAGLAFWLFLTRDWVAQEAS